MQGEAPVGPAMKHATTQTLRSLSALLVEIRKRDSIRERKLGIFYKGARSFLHFHENPAGLFADVSRGADFVRYPVNTRVQWKVLLDAIDDVLAE